MSASPSRWINGVMNDDDNDAVVVSSLPPPQLNRNTGDNISHKYELSEPSTFPEAERNRTIGSISVDDDDVVVVGLFFQFCVKSSNSP